MLTDSPTGNISVCVEYFLEENILVNKFEFFIPEKAMAPHSSTLAWKIPWMEEPGRLQSMGSRQARVEETAAPSLIDRPAPNQAVRARSPPVS